MKKNILYLIILFAGIISFNSCSDDDPDKSNSIFNETENFNSFDKWLDKNYRQPYNIRVAYRIEDIETDFTFNVVPADIKKSKQMAIILKHLWLEAYTEVASDGVNFIRDTAPKLFHFIGSAEHDPQDGTIRLGVAEGGHKITITEVNYLKPSNVISQNYFNTVHHEFAHILHQTKAYPREFSDISAVDYAPTTWMNRKDTTEIYRMGLVSAYAGKLPNEDFVEVIARYITRSEAHWNRMLEVAGEIQNPKDPIEDQIPYEGRAKIEQKFAIAKKYLIDIWGVDIEELKTVVWRRANELEYMDFENLDF